MSEFNFDKMRNFKAPDEWAEKTISIVNEKKSARYYHVKRLRICVACICLILLCMFSFTFCIRILGNSFITPVNVEETITKNDNDERPIKDRRENSIWDNDEETDYIEDSETAVTESETSSSTEETKTKETVKKESSKNKSEKVKETQKPTSAKKPSKTEKDPQNNQSRPNNKPVVRPTQKPVQKPSTDNKPKPTQAPPVYIEPTETPVENKIVCSITINKSQLSDSNKVYCRIYSCDEDIYLGDSDLYSLQHLAEVYSASENSYSVKYFPAKKGVVNKNGEYIATFYDENGKNLKVYGFNVIQF